MSLDWHIRKKNIREIKNLLPPINKLPTVRGGMDFIAEDLQDNVSILDVGAYDRNLHDFLVKSCKKEFSYWSMDIDKSLSHDYYSFEEIQKKFDVIACLEIIEHLTSEEALDLLAKEYELLKEGGVLYISTPNVFHPTAFWRDSTHRSGYRYGELAGFLAALGYRELEIYRVGRIKFLNKVRAVLVNPALRLLQMDYYSRILIKARKKKGEIYAG
jgi:SAM-dependent methyltransferase